MVTKETRHMLKVRKRVKSAKPKFKRQELGRQPLLKDTWRKPKGRHSKMRMHEKARGRLPSKGYSSPSEVRGLNRLGYREVVVHNIEEISGLNPREEMAVISAGVGKKKRFGILEAAKEKSVKVTNA